jgi:hypothetical protein
VSVVRLRWPAVWLGLVVLGLRAVADLQPADRFLERDVEEARLHRRAVGSGLAEQAIAFSARPEAVLQHHGQALGEQVRRVAPEDRLEPGPERSVEQVHLQGGHPLVRHSSMAGRDDAKDIASEVFPAPGRPHSTISLAIYRVLRSTAAAIAW